MIVVSYSDELFHHGVKGQKWGVRRYQNEDGSYKKDAEGRYADGTLSKVKKVVGSAKNKIDYAKETITSDRVKTIAKVGAAVAGAALVAYGGYKLSNIDTNKFDVARNLISKSTNKSIKLLGESSKKAERVARKSELNMVKKQIKMSNKHFDEFLKNASDEDFMSGKVEEMFNRHDATNEALMKKAKEYTSRYIDAVFN